MIARLLHAELLKLRTTRTFIVLVGTALALTLLVVVLSAVLRDDLDATQVRELFGTDFSSLFILLLGVVGMAGEWRHRTITSTILAAPDRLRLLTAKTVSYAVAGLVLSLIVTAASMTIGTLILSIRGGMTIGAIDLADVLWRNLVVAALLGALGVCVGALVRNQVAAIVALLILAFALEPTLMGVASEVARFGPTGGAPSGITGHAVQLDESVLLAPGTATAVMIAWVAAAFATSAALLGRRDLIE